MTERVCIQEVGLRDGLQMVKETLPTATKTEWITAQAAIGFKAIEVTSFVPPTLLPQFADAAEVMAAANKTPNLTAAALALNLKGAMNALAVGTPKLTFVLSASEAHNHSNVRCDTDVSLSVFSDVIAHAGATSTEIRAAIATSFGCSLQGDVSEDRVVDLAQLLEQAGAREITLADTVGYANPKQVNRLFSRVAQVVKVPLAAHFHDTRGMGLANVVAALDAGVRNFDASLGGLGGCPFAPGASGNIATEDCVYLIESMGFSTGIDLNGLLDLRLQLTDWLPGELLSGRLGVAGPARTFHSIH
ncbi:MAG: hydroxymethylglutaryl-CoA lyase [Paracoccaceae bacterium]|nr:hydroxymethylglutaryl-CoA lyase [Paracoccaceae bacterium]